MRKVHLQGIGEKPAVTAAELQKGDVTIWNYGYTETILNIAKETEKTITFKIRCNESGYVGTRRLNKSRLIAKMV